MPPKDAQKQKMIEKCQEKISALEEQLASGALDEAGQAAAMKSIDDQLSKIERLNEFNSRLKAVKKAV